MNMGGVLQALVDKSDCSKPPCNSLGSDFPYMSYPAFADFLLAKFYDLNLVNIILVNCFFSQLLVWLI